MTTVTRPDSSANHVSPWLRAIPLLVLVLSLALTLYFWRLYDAALRDRAQMIYEEKTATIVDHIGKRLHDHEQVLRGGTGLFNASDMVSRQEWQRYVSSLKLEEYHPGILGVGFSLWIEPKDKAKHLSQIRGEGFADYDIRPSGERQAYTSIIYLEPFHWRNQRAFGYDMFSEPTRRAAMERARDSGETSIAANIILVQETEKDRQNGILMYVPVYRRGMPASTVEERRAALVGFVYSPIRMDDFMLATLGNRLPEDIAFELYSAQEMRPETLMYSSQLVQHRQLPAGYRPLYRSEITLRDFGQDWRMAFQTLPPFAREMSRGSSYAALAGGLLVSSLLTAISFILLSSFVKISRSLHERQRLEEARRRMEQQMVNTQKLESLGLMAGGIAHDFNNLLMVVIGNAELAEDHLPPGSPAQGNLQAIQKAAMRAADLAKQMLAYSGKGKFFVERIDLNRLVADMEQMLAASVGKNAVLSYRLDPASPWLKADANQLRQIVMNLVLNASEAIPETGGTIVLRSGVRECSASYLAQHWQLDPLPAGHYAYIEVTDSGCGMDADTIDRIFDPFFTTKFTGRGLGMAAVLGIVRGHGGAVTIASQPGKGSAVTVLLPAEEAERDETPAPPPVGVADDWRGRGRVLLVDDEAPVREIASGMLREAGFTEVLTAVDGQDALEKYRAHPDIRLVILDLTMPNMGGESCFRELRRLNPGVKVVMSSGYSEEQVLGKIAGGREGLAGFVQKPYTLAALRDALGRIGG